VCAEHFISRWVAHSGVSATVTTDKGTQFTSAAWAEICKQLGIQHLLTTSFHRQANGMVDRAHRQIRDALHARTADPDWHSLLLGLC
jgi:transposase InsO family protein